MSTSLPEALLRSLSKLSHFDPQAFLAAHEMEQPLVSVHMNSGKPILDEGQWPARFTDPPFEISGPVPWACDGWYLSRRPSFTLDPLFHAGGYYVQEASGMFLSYVLRQTLDLSKKIKALDLCAAPGGKSTMIQSHLSADSLLVSNEVIKTRVPVLYENMTKWGRANGVVTQNDPVHFKQVPDFFDLMLIDAPCSGSGLFRKDPEAMVKWSPELVGHCCQRQHRILQDVWDSLKEGGLLIYSTCSYSKEENEDVLDWVFQHQPCSSLALFPNPAWGIVETRADLSGAYGYRFYPDKLSGEGFFLSVLRKEGTRGSGTGQVQTRTVKISNHPERISKTAEKQLKHWIRDGAVQYVPVGEAIHGIPQGLVDDFNRLKNALYLKKAGIRLGKSGENDWIPDHELALADILSENQHCLNLEKKEALEFLQGNSLELGQGERGWCLVRYEGLGLGWVKLLDKRINNYYPKSWRIRQSIF